MNASAPCSAEALDVLVIKAWPLYRTAETLLSSTSTLVEDLLQLLKDTRYVNQEFSKWPAGQLEEWKPRTLGFINTKHIGFTDSVSNLRVDAYLDRKHTTPVNTFAD